MGTQYIPEMPALRQGRQQGSETHGIDSELFDREWNEFLARRMELYENMTARLGLAQGIADATGIAPEEALPAAHIEMDSVWNDKLKNRFASLTPPQLNELIGQGRAHGIDSPEKLPPELLFRMIEERRAAVKGRDPDEDLPASLGEWGALAARRIRGEKSVGLGNRALSEQMGAGALGTFEGLLGMAQSIPFIGDALAKTRVIKAADQAVHMALEGMRADLPEERMQAFDLAAGTGGFVAYTYMGLAAYRGLAATVIPASAIVNGKRIDTLGRASLRGALTVWALEGGGDDPIMPAEETWRAIADGDWKRAIEVLQTRSGKIAAGGALGAFFDYALPNLARRLMRSFPGGIDAEYANRFSGGRVYDADYSMVEDVLLTPGRNQLPPSRGQIAAGPDGLPPGTDLTPLGPGPQGIGPGPRQLPAGPQAGPMALVRQLDELGVQTSPAGWDTWYHGTTQPLTEIRPGLHLGSQLAATQRATDVIGEFPAFVAARRGLIYPVAVDPQARMLGTREAPLLGDINPDVGVYGTPGDEQMLQQAQQEGYQGAYYRNDIEDPASTSLYLMDPSAARVLPPQNAPLVTPAPTGPRLLGTALHNENAALRQQLNQMVEQRNLAQRMAEMDPLTNLGNRRAMERAMPAVAADPDLVVIAWDADEFKPINDNFGHDAGDQALVAFANHLNEVADFLQRPARNFRPGGDEFVTVITRDRAEDFLAIVEEYSGQNFTRGEDGEVFVTKLTGGIGDDYLQADANLTAIKGGRRTGSEALVPEEAVAEAQALTRQNQVLESPYLNEVMDQRAFDVTDVVQAVQMSNPSGVNVIRNVGDAGSVIRRLAEADMSLPMVGVLRHPTKFEDLDIRREGTGYLLRRTNLEQTPYREPSRESQILTQLFDVDEVFEPDATSAIRAARSMGYVVPTRRVMPQFMRVVERPSPNPYHADAGEVVQDLMISAGRPITNQMVEEYRATGAFAGARIRHHSGIEGDVEMVILDDDPSLVIRHEDGRGLDVFPGEFYLVADNYSLPTDFDQFYESFKADALDQIAMAHADILDIVGTSERPMEWLSEPMISQMPRMLDDYLDLREIEDNLTRSAYRAGVNNQINRELQALAAPEDQALLTRAMEILDGSMEQRASTRRRRRGEARVPHVLDSGVTYQAPRPTLPDVQTLAETKGFDYIPSTPRALRYGATIDIMPAVPGNFRGEQADIYVNMTDTRTGDYAGYMDATLRGDGTFYVGYIEAHAAGGPTALGPRMVRDLGRQVVEAVRAQGLTINTIRGVRVSGARRASYNFSGADNDMVIDADQMLQGSRRGGTLKHKFSDLEVPVDSDEAALGFLNEFEGELPDIAPITGYPVDALPIVPGMDNPGHSQPPVWDEGHEQFMDTYIDMTDRMESYLDDVIRGDDPTEPDMWTGGFAGGNLPPGGPPRPPARYTGAPLSGGGRPGGGVPGTEVRSETLGQQFRTLQRNNPAAVGELIRRQEGAWIRLMEPWRHRMLSLEVQMQDVGLTMARPWEQTTRMTTAVDKSHNEAIPWHSEWTGITSQFRRKYRRDGTVVRIEEIPNWNDKLRAMEEAGYTPKEMEAQNQIRPFFDRLHGEAGLTHYIFNYIPHLRQRQGMNGIEDPYKGMDAGLPSELKFFAEHMRAGNVDMRQLDIGTLGALWIRGWQFKKHVGPIWEETYQTWTEAGIPEPIKNVILDWMHVVRVGHDPKEEIAVAGARQTLNSLGIPVTSGEIAGLWNGLLTNTYRSMLGGRPDVIFRDMIQPLLSWARVGGNIEDMARVYTDFIRDPKARGEMIERAERMGTVVRGMTQTSYAEAFTQRVQTNEGYPIFSPEMEARREAVATIGDFLSDLVPAKFRGGIQGTLADPLLAYTKMGEMNRIVSGEYGYRTARKALDQYFGGQMDYTTLVSQSRARVYPQPIQRRFQELVESGDKEGAAALLANESANLQFRYGSREGPVGTRNVPGRLSMMFGTFSQQFLAYTKEGLTHGTMGDRAGFGARYAAILAAIGGAGLATGWSFSKWMWHNSLAFAGGPIVEFAATLAHAAGGFSAKAQGQNVRPHQARAMEEMQPENVAGGFLESIFPYSGAVRTAQKTINTLGPDKPHQGERMLELLLTGNPQWESIYERDYRNEFPPHTPDFSQPLLWQPHQGTGGFPQPHSVNPARPPTAPWDTLSTEAVGAMQQALSTTPPDQWGSRMQGAGYNDAIVQQVIRAGAGAHQ